MSYKATAWAYELPIKGAAKPVLVALADFADEAGSCYPGQDKLCAMTGLSLRTVRRALERLDAYGLLTRERRFDTYGHRTSDRYYLQLDIKSLPATVTSGQSDLRSESPSLPATVSIPTGHSDRVTISRTTSDPPGGRVAPYPALEAVDNPPRPDPWCKRHAATEGLDTACAACKSKRLAAERWDADLIAGSRSEQWTAKRKPVVHYPGLCDAHRQPEANCDACAEDRAKGRTA